MKNKILTVFVSFMLTASVTFSQEIKTDPVQLEATALKKDKGKFISGLGKNDFLLYERGRTVEIIMCSEIEAPLSIVLLIDMSRSMRDIMKPTIEVALEVAKSIRPEDEAAIIAFAKGAELVQDFTRDKRIIEDRIKKIDESVKLDRLKTELDEALLQATAHLGKATIQNSRRVIIAITDNMASRHPERTRKEALRELSRFGGIVCGLVALLIPDEKMYGPPLKETAERMHTDPSARPVESESPPVPDGSLEIYTKESGGFLLEFRGEDIEAKVAALIDIVRSYYLIEYKSPSRVATAREIKLKMSKKAEKREGAAKLIVKQKAQAQ